MDEDSATPGRSKRIKQDKSGRASALERLKSLKGKKNKCVVEEIENVYDEVDEKEYAKRVLSRQEEDWIVDEGNGYIEDGREIFDDDGDDESIIQSSKKQKMGSMKKILSDKKKSKNIMSMLADMPTKSKTQKSVKKTTNEEDDALFNSILAELASDTPKKESTPSTSSLSSKEYLKSFTKSSPKPDNVIKTVLDTSKIKNRIGLKRQTDESSEIVPAPVKNVNESQFQSQNDDFSSNSISDDPPHIKSDENEGCTPIKEEESQPSCEQSSMDCDVDINDFMEDDDMEFVCEKADEQNNEPEVKVTEQQLTEGWETNNMNINLPCEPVTVDTSSLPLVTNSEGEKVFRFYWFDAYEDPVKQPGVVYMFGKVYIESAKSYVSCCVTVKNIQRKIYLLPREKKFDMKTNTQTEEPITVLDVYQEFNQKIANSYKIMNFLSRKVVKKYAFELSDVPEESEYLEVKYPSTGPKLQSDLSGETFSRVFGTNTSALELLLVDRKIKGPAWLEIKNPQPANAPCSWCKTEAICSKPDDVFVSTTLGPPPPLTVIAINIRTVVNQKNMQNEIVMISCLVHNEYQIDKPAPNPPFRSHFCAFTKPSDIHWPFNAERILSSYKGTEIFRHETERSLINFFLTKLFVIDPDVVVGHDLYGFTIDTLIYRIENMKISNWSRLGRLRRSIIPHVKGKQVEKNLLCGRLICDINISAKELIRARSYDLDTLCKQILRIGENSREDYSSEEIVLKYSKAGDLISLINATMQDTSYILKLMYELNVLPLALQITNIAGNVMSRTLLGGRSERNEFLLLHAFTEKDYIVPDKNYNKKVVTFDEDSENVPKNSKKKPQYIGGLVLEPKKGFYDKFILLMDFNSLYPSIIQEYNICFTTVVRLDNEEVEPDIPDKSLPPGILPTEIRKLVESRRQVKSLMKTPDLTPELKMQYNIRQMALKLTANSMYGCLGFAHSRFYAKPLAALVTSRGREILMNTKEIVMKMNFDVIYGDTDSIMINTNSTDYNQVFKIGHKIKQEINKMYKHVELEVDGVFKYMLLLKKKKYAAVVLSKKPNGEVMESHEYKGLDIVRRDWSQLSAEVGRHVLNQILSDISPDERIANIREHLEKISSDLRNKLVPISLLAISKQLAKNPEDYADKKSLPHLQVAMRINSRGGKKLKAGDTVSYVICDDGSNLPAVQRAYHVDELKTNEHLLVDVNYYLSQQIHPVVSRLCEPIDGTDPAFIAECLGLDPNSYKKAIKTKEDEDNDAEGDYTLINDIQSFKNCDGFSFTCMNENCRTKIFLDGPLRDNYPALNKCRNPNCKTSPIEYLPAIQNVLQMTIRRYINKLYENWLVCEDPGCPNRTRRLPMMFINSFPVCTLCKKGLMYREYRSSDLYCQLKYFEYMFNLKKAKVPVSSAVENAYKTLHNQVLETLNTSGYRYLDFGKIFKFYTKENKGKYKMTAIQRKILDSQKQWEKL
ncbi:UNVERIFIED_CONTAM: hypothetical protein PYX00_003535 [Menopon gallinae]|uniref:DNA polymerase n=1 Tax=Menopon gallinae TaxID=328185 RepID=A0AAW2I1I5_9NEOP